MFNCYAHNWSHMQNPCPLCHPMEVITSNGSTFQLPLIWRRDDPAAPFYREIKALKLKVGQLDTEIEIMKARPSSSHAKGQE